MNIIQRASAGLASAAIVFAAATVCAQADTRPALAMAPGSPDLAIAPARIKGALYTQIPALAQLAGLHGSAVVQVDLDETGRVTNATVVRSTGNLVLDRAAIKTVQSASYEPASAGNVPVAGAFDIVVDFANEN